MDDNTLGTLISTGLSLGGAGLGAYSQQGQYNLLQNALKTIGPTALNGYTLAGPGGMSSGYTSNGQGSIGLGSLTPAFGNLSSAAGTGSGAYNPGLLQALTGNAAGTLGLSTNALGSAYGNYAAGMGAANQQLGSLGGFSGTYQDLLAAQRGQLAPQIQQQAYGLQNSLFGKGVLDSTGAASGSMAEQNFGRGVGQADSAAQLNAFQQALDQQRTAASNYGTLTNSANGILSNAFSNFGNTNQLISGLNTAQLNNSLQAIQGAGALNTLGLNNYNAALGTGMGQATARNQSLFPYASTASALAGTPNATSLLGNALSKAGANGSSLSSLIGTGRSLYNGYQSLFGSGSGIGSVGSFGDISAGLDSSTGSMLSGTSADIAAGNDAWLTGGGGFEGFSSAGGGAAGGAAAAAGEPALASVGTGAVDTAANSALAGASTSLADSGAASGGAALGGGASADGAGSAALGVGAGAASAVGLFALPLMLGLTQPTTKLDKSWWQGMESAIKTGGQTSPEGVQLATMMANGDPQAIALGRQYGIKPLTPYTKNQLISAGGRISPMRS